VVRLLPTTSDHTENKPGVRESKSQDTKGKGESFATNYKETPWVNKDIGCKKQKGETDR